MCGIVGFIGFELNQDPKFVLQQMIKALTHRGPDAKGVWINSQHQIALGHTRLSIMDLSDAGSQPMWSFCQRYVIIFNGEIYNHFELRKELEKTRAVSSWKGHSDTETLINAISIWGLEKTLKRTRGMFALALWDQQEQKLYLARDRVGEKPLYYGWVNGNFVFTSELKSLKKFPGFTSAISQQAFESFMIYRMVPGPLSIYEDIFKLEAGTILEMSLDKQTSCKEYWRFDDVACNFPRKTYRSEKNAIQECKTTLSDAIRLQLSADVPVGAFLSGGIDSSTIVALMQELSPTKVKTFSIGFNEKHFDESIYATEVAKRLGTEHHSEILQAEHVLEYIPQISRIYDEPFADSSQIPTFLVSKMARAHVKVVLSGDAGDELFGGYFRYLVAKNIWDKISFLPCSLRKKMGTFLENNVGVISKLLSMSHLLKNNALIENRLLKLSKMMVDIESIDKFYHSFLTHGGEIRLSHVNHFFSRFNLEKLQCLSAQERMMYYDSMHYLPNDILTKIDRASMSLGLETRVPFLDSRVIDFAWSLPQHMKIRRGETKWILRQVLSEYLPQHLINRPKMGFAVPLELWLKTHLRDWAESLISEDALKHGYLNPQMVMGMWQDHLAGRSKYASQLWNILMFQAWYQEYF